MKIRHALLFAFALIGVFITLGMIGVTRGVSNFVSEVAMIVPALAFIAFMVNRQQKM